jgi:hypothetical protein
VPVFRNRSSGATQLSFESEQLDDENALKAFGTLRAVLTSSEHGGIIPENALWVGVPSRFFRDDIHQDNVPILVDLPGEGSAEVAEKYHVPALVRKWLLVASTVVVVENVAHVMRLKDLKFGSETRAGWLYWPGDLAIALTRVFEDHTVRKWVDYTTTLDELVNRIREPIQSKLFEDETAQARDVAQQRLAQSLILPFDFGETLSRLKENHPRDHAKVAPWLTDGMERQLCSRRMDCFWRPVRGLSSGSPNWTQPGTNWPPSTRKRNGAFKTKRNTRQKLRRACMTSV